jgi:glycosyltransferase involved in cell wall biosynthesis
MFIDLNISDKYVLSLLKDVQKDDIEFYLKKGNGIYICNFPDYYWHNVYNIKTARNYSINKKNKIFNCLSSESILVSPTEIDQNVFTNKNITYGRISHLKSIFNISRLKQIEYSFRLLFFVFKNHKKYDYILYYNFEMPIFFTALIFKYILNKKIYVDFEDDYSLLNRNILKNTLNKLLFKIPELVICVNKAMINNFSSKTKCLIFNGFIDLEYMKQLDCKLNENSKFLFAGSLDKIRGADLIQEVAIALRKKVKNFKIYVCGTGPLEKVLTGLNISEIEFKGFLNDLEYDELLKECDYFLVLQKPDHPFSNGSFPSKIEYYSKFKKPIFHLKIIS